MFQVAEDNAKGLVQAHCSLGMNAFITGPFQHEVLVTQEKKSKRLHTEC